MAALDQLPPEVLSNILSFTSPFDWVSSSPGRPLDTLAATNRYLHDVVEAYARLLLKKHAGLDAKSWRVENYRQSAFLTDELDVKRSRVLSYRRKWFKWLSTHCQTCQKKSVRRAILDSRTVMCAACDKKIPKMTMTDAMRKYQLTHLEIFTPNFYHPTLPPLTIGTYKCMGSDTTMISTPDVLARAELLRSMAKRGEDIRPASYSRRLTTHKRLMADLGVTYDAGKLRKLRVSCTDDWDERRARAMTQLRDVWRENGIHPAKGAEAMLFLDPDLRTTAKDKQGDRPVIELD